MGLMNGIKAFLEGLLLRPIDNRPIGLGPIHDMSDDSLLNHLAHPATRPQFNVPQPAVSPYNFSALPATLPKTAPPPRPKREAAVSPAFARVPSSDYTFRKVPPRFNPWTQKSL